MCGVFGFVSYDGKGPNLKRLAAIAVATETRGRDAFGFAWVDDRGRIRYYKQRGPIGLHLDKLTMLSGARMLIGHCRWSTHGSESDAANNHPHPCDGGWIVHNGVIGNYRSILAKHDIPTVTDCDSEALGLLIENADGKLIERVKSTVTECAETSLVMLGLWSRPARLIIARAGNPLHWSQVEGRFYFGSLATALPGIAKAFPDNHVKEFRPGQPCPKMPVEIPVRPEPVLVARKYVAWTGEEYFATTAATDGACGATDPAGRPAGESYVDKWNRDHGHEYPGLFSGAKLTRPNETKKQRKQREREERRMIHRAAVRPSDVWTRGPVGTSPRIRPLFNSQGHRIGYTDGPDSPDRLLSDVEPPTVETDGPDRGEPLTIRTSSDLMPIVLGGES